MRHAGVGNVTTAGLALALPGGWKLWRIRARANRLALPHRRPLAVGRRVLKTAIECVEGQLWVEQRRWCR